MGLLDGLEPKGRTYDCKVATVAQTLDNADSVKLLEAVADKAWNYQSLEYALRERGIELGRSSIKRHRLNLCSCGKK